MKRKVFSGGLRIFAQSLRRLHAGSAQRIRRFQALDTTVPGLGDDGSKPWIRRFQAEEKAGTISALIIK